MSRLANDTGISGADGLTNDPRLSLTGIETAPGTLVEYSLDGATWTAASPTIADLLQGPNTVQVRQTDVAGNVSAASVLGFSLDTVAPAALGVALANDTGMSGADGLTNDPRLSLTGIEMASGTLVEYSLDGVTWTAASPTIPDLLQGTNTVQMRQTDVAGNVSAASVLGFSLDTVAPAALGVALANDTGMSGADGLTNDPRLSLTGIETAPGALVEYSLDGVTWTAAPPTIADLLQGPNTVQVRQTDVAGNVSAASVLGFSLDTVAPAALGVALANDTGMSGADGLTNDPRLSLTGIEMAPGTLVEYSLDGATWTAAPPTIADLLQGTNTVQVRQTDVAGNVSAASVLGFSLDTVAPAALGVALANDTGMSGADGLTKDPSLSLTGVETAPGALVEYSLDGVTWTAAPPTLADLLQGTNTVQVRQTDVAGNVSAASGTRLLP